MVSEAAHDVGAGRDALDLDQTFDEVPDMLYPVGCLVEGGGPEGELVRYAAADEPAVVTSPVSDVLLALRVPQPVVMARQALASLGAPEFVFDELVEARWVVEVPASSALNPVALAGYRLVPNVSDMAGDGEYGLVVTSATSNQTATVLASTVAVLRRGMELDVPAAVSAAAEETGLPVTVVGESLMTSLVDLLATSNAYLVAPA